MSVEIIAELERAISTLGFPIFCCVMLWKKITESDEKQTALINELTISIVRLTDYLKGSNEREGEKK